MLEAVLVLRECGPGVVWGIDVDASNLPREFLLKGLKREKVVSENESVVKEVVTGNLLRCMK